MRFLKIQFFVGLAFLVSFNFAQASECDPERVTQWEFKAGTEIYFPDTQVVRTAELAFDTVTCVGNREFEFLKGYNIHFHETGEVHIGTVASTDLFIEKENGFRTDVEVRVPRYSNIAFFSNGNVKDIRLDEPETIYINRYDLSVSDRIAFRPNQSLLRVNVRSWRDFDLRIRVSGDSIPSLFRAGCYLFEFDESNYLNDYLMFPRSACPIRNISAATSARRIF